MVDCCDVVVTRDHQWNDVESGTRESSPLKVVVVGWGVLPAGFAGVGSV